MPVAVSIRGQTVIPAEIRKKYGIKVKSRVEFVDTGEEIILVPLPDKPFEDSYGILKGVSTDYLIKTRRKERCSEIAKKNDLCLRHLSNPRLP